MTLNPYSNDDYFQASEHLRLAISLLAKHNIPPSPMNYRLGYDYVAGKSKELIRSLDEIIIESKPIPVEKLWELYQHFFIQDEKVLEKMRQELRQVIARLQIDVSRSGGDLSSYQQTLSRFADILGSNAPEDQMSDEVNKVINDTRSMEQSNQLLQSNMTSLMAEVETLKQELEQVKQESLTDGLTGISNRKAFDAILKSAVQQASMEKSPFCLILADVDHFKKFNDSYGHLAGDKVLRYVALTLKRSLNGRQLAARFGGEEFALALPKTGMASAEGVAERIRKTISQGDLIDKGNGQNYGRITVSIGIAQYRRNELASDLVRRADQAMYMAKEKGRNRVEKVLN